MLRRNTLEVCQCGCAPPELHHLLLQRLQSLNNVHIGAWLPQPLLLLERLLEEALEPEEEAEAEAEAPRATPLLERES